MHEKRASGGPVPPHFPAQANGKEDVFIDVAEPFSSALKGTPAPAAEENRGADDAYFQAAARGEAIK